MLAKEIRAIFHKELKELFPKEEIDSFFYAMLDHYLGLERFVLAVQPNLVLTKEEEAPFFEGLSQLNEQRPIQYILGVTPFRNMELAVNESVLIPRPETEELVEWVISEYQGKDLGKDNQTSDFSILDIGTGSGCIAISLAKELDVSHVFALDISKEALVLAEQNAAANDVELHFIHESILNPNIDLEGKKYDVIISNPPYVREIEKTQMAKNVMAYEPHTALFVPDDNPLIFYKAILKFAQLFLKKEGSLFLEINEALGQEMMQLARNNGFTKLVLKQDMFGKVRMLRVMRNQEDKLLQ